MLDKASPVEIIADTARIVTNGDTETLKWFRKNYLNDNAIPTLVYMLTSKMGEWDDNILLEESAFFQNQHSEFLNRAEKLQQEFKALRHKTDEDSVTKLLDVINELVDCDRYAEQSKKAAEVFKNFIPTNNRAAEDLRKQKVGAKLKAARLAKGFSQTELGKMIGVTKGTVSTYESGEREPPIKTLILIAKNLKISLDELFELEK